jgi:hypothetical protein
LSDAARRKAVDVRRQRRSHRPSVDGIDLPAGPVDGDVVVGEATKLFQEKHNRPRSGLIEMHHVAREEERVGAFGERGLEDLLGGEVRRFEEGFAQVSGNFGHACQRAFQM